MDWTDWYKYYNVTPSLQARLRLVREQVAATLAECPSGPITIVSVCAGDGRDIIGALHDYGRRNDVIAWLLDADSESLARGQAAATAVGLERQLQFLHADAGLTSSYRGIGRADLLVLSGMCGYVRHGDVARLIESLPMLCKAGGWVLWSRHLVPYEGREQVPAIRAHLRRTGFEEVHVGITAPDDFAVGRARFAGRAIPLDPAQVLCEFVGLDRPSSVHPWGVMNPPATVYHTTTTKGDMLTCMARAEYKLRPMVSRAA